MLKTRRKLYGLSYVELIVLAFAYCQGENYLEEPRAHHKVKILVYEKFTELILTRLFLI